MRLNVAWIHRSLWTMHFDGASSKEGLGVGVVFVSPKNNTFIYSFTLIFLFTNNIVKYEALVLGLRVENHHGINKLHVIRDSELVTSQVRETYASKIKRLKQYRNVVWDKIELFDAFGIYWMERSHNKMDDLLVNVAIKQNECIIARISQIEVQNQPSILDNIEHWKVFEGDRNILNFLSSEDGYHG